VYFEKSLKAYVVLTYFDYGRSVITLVLYVYVCVLLII